MGAIGFSTEQKATILSEFDRFDNFVVIETEIGYCPGVNNGSIQ